MMRSKKPEPKPKPKDEQPVLVFKFCDQPECNGQCGYFWSDGRRATWGEPHG